jgi:hypothetical protein
MNEFELVMRAMLRIDHVPINISMVPALYMDKKSRYKLEIDHSMQRVCGIHMMRNGEHYIWLSEEYNDDEYKLQCTFAHELVHVWQWENLPYIKGRARTHHGKRDYFNQWADYIYQELDIII